MRILLVEDDLSIRGNVATLLGSKGYGVDEAKDRESAYEKIANTSYDLIVIDRGLPDGDGVALVRTIRQEGSSVLLLLLTARGEPEDIVEGLNAGADDYLVKPFRFAELDARIRALLRRASSETVLPSISLADLYIDTNTHAVTRRGTRIALAPKEYALLEYLARNKGVALERMAILEHVWNEHIDELSQTVDVHIRYLRKKIDDPYQKKLIRTVKGKGYMLCGE